ncbi:16S rRNA (cytosine(1402)-N(4))-methyltransferase RsmH [Candidatus Sulfidibacterium hydrothermale]|uniref:16S rRNA (cytosine(1402)-N(4))-methyltransferase RsmH n=1 Tax=Candidatus Sulfidibacterium hydrothermale TaxID=2875962 RepID=UPI001F0AE8C6|nr:16S rRNA (cytosine(1402)-N(4))-methyltransferase RsmH [Candidatus Sulfidibacterium hydrothermale]UBM63057.1 16S rRNA (cytosine(1402)-N(4))-methyltransferase RsmH [Candidatus Sulfidibacterium hydrothermale]
MYHNPVLLHKSIDGLRIHPGGIYVDATFGGGGHARAILEKLGPDGTLVAFDQDPEAEANKPDDERLIFVNQNFRYLKNFLRLYDKVPVDGILADLGVSSHQFDEGARGFSIRFDGPLDMRMGKHQEITAADVLNEYSQEEIQQIIRLYGEIKNSRCMAEQIVSRRKQKPFETTFELIEAVEKCIPPTRRNKMLAMLFQALRIEVNQELEALKAFLEQTVDVLKPGGRLVVIAYHSLEDRLVKNFIKTGNFEGKVQKDFFGNDLVEMKPVVNKVIVPDEEEIMRNSRARSARMRVAEKLPES